ncbi:MAG: type 1 glutamine amidotransferase [Paracoccaceae bacterium]
MRVAIVENMKDTPLGQVGAALAEAQAEITHFTPHAGNLLPSDPDAYDALVVLGGEQSALDDGAHPYLPDLARLMHDFANADRAVLGICLGAQILARGFGGRNILGAAPEFGWQGIALTSAGQLDPVLSAAGARFPIFQWHSDTFDLPAGAVHLARNGTVENQAFRLGRAAYGMQFHFEAHRGIVADWSRAFPDAAHAMRPDWSDTHGRDAGRFADASDAAGLALARAWVAQI